jgi:hypothetical protein
MKTYEVIKKAFIHLPGRTLLSTTLRPLGLRPGEFGIKDGVITEVAKIVEIEGALYAVLEERDQSFAAIRLDRTKLRSCRTMILKGPTW